ncbi:hypothetical protein RJ641_020178 [Dillenia turbinata]|uniref:Uncharacterized protein n=1 Tax=Dillenia turbinata TaxID=194707 RepID=A0AAN8YVZ1_9MAGN
MWKIIDSLLRDSEACTLKLLRTHGRVRLLLSYTLGTPFWRSEMLHQPYCLSAIHSKVAVPPGQWIPAGGSMIVESDKQTVVVRKHYIGMVTMLDRLAHMAEHDAGDDGMDGQDRVFDVEKKMSVPVSSIVGHCLVPPSSDIVLENSAGGLLTPVPGKLNFANFLFFTLCILILII